VQQGLDMHFLTNKHNRRIGLPAEKNGGILLDVDEARTVTNEHFKELIKSKKTMGMISTGTLVDVKVDTATWKDKVDS
jgi:hypothetical protein